jgi:threonyl-tRNA synthetase
MVHRAPFGSMERFVGVLIEHFNGNFPLWLAPEQVCLLTVSEKVDDYATEALAFVGEHDAVTQVNRWLARRLLAERILERTAGERSVRQQAAEKIRRQKRRRSRRQKARMLDDKREHAERKTSRKTVEWEA